MLDFAQARRNMVDSQVRTFDVFDIPLLAVLDELPRERFAPEGRESLAYIDLDLPVAEGIAGERRYMLKPMILARMIQSLDVEAGHRVLDVAPGLGYSTAVLARLGARVIGLEAAEDLAAEATRRLAAVGIEGATVASGPLQEGYPDGAPYDAILVNGLLGMRPDALLAQLADGGRLICVEQTGRAGRAVLYTRSGDAVGSRSVFDAGAEPLKAFAQEPGFVF